MRETGASRRTLSRELPRYCPRFPEPLTKGWGSAGSPLPCEKVAGVSDRLRVLIVATHPIQYQVPWFRALANVATIDLSVLYIQRPDAAQQGVGFDIPFEWDIPLLEGYGWTQAPDVRGRGGLTGFFASRLAHPSRLLRDLTPDALLLTGWHAWPLLQLLLAARRQGLPVLMRGDSNALRRRPLPVRLLHRLLFTNCAAFLTVGKSNRDLYRDAGVPEKRLFSAPHFVDNARFGESAAQLSPRRDELRQSWRIPKNAVCFCFVGKLQRVKRIFDLLEAMKLVQARTEQSIHLLIVGTGELMRQAREMAERQGLPITFTGFVNQTEIPAAYVATDCLVLPSDHETWGLVLNEAMACGLPAIVSDRVGCAADLITEGETGALFPFGDVQALARCLIAMAADPARMRAMGVRARNRVEREYSVAKAVDGTLAALRFTCGST